MFHVKRILLLWRLWQGCQDIQAAVKRLGGGDMMTGIGALLKTKTFWAGVLMLAGAGGFYLQGDQAQASTLLALALASIFGRAAIGKVEAALKPK